jgi:DNA-binding Xre family transcriptional regulator
MSRDIEPELMNSLLEVIRAQGVKIPALSKAMGVPNRTLQRYLYKETSMPIWVFLGICEHLNCTAEFIRSGSVKLDHRAMCDALEATFGDMLRYVGIEFLPGGQSATVKLLNEPMAERPHGRTRSILARDIAQHYAHVLELRIIRQRDSEELE